MANISPALNVSAVAVYTHYRMLSFFLFFGSDPTKWRDNPGLLLWPKKVGGPDSAPRDSPVPYLSHVPFFALGPTNPLLQ